MKARRTIELVSLLAWLSAGCARERATQNTGLTTSITNETTGPAQGVRTPGAPGPARGTDAGAGTVVP